MSRLPKAIRSALEDSGKPYRVEAASKHRKIVVGGRLVGTIPNGRLHSAGRATKNIVAQIRRA